jgi:molybdate transport system substrate-binding protein
MPYGGDGRTLGRMVAKGEVELGIFLINVLTAPGLHVVGPFPAELQQEVVFTAAMPSPNGPAEWLYPNVEKTPCSTVNRRANLTPHAPRGKTGQAA